MYKKTKIICTMGPASANREVLTAMIKNGMNVARLNFSHGTHETHQKTINLIKEIREELNVPLPIMLDTKGPEYRIGTFKDGPVVVEDGADFSFYCTECEGSLKGVSVSYANLYKELEPGDTILVNDGLVSFTVESIEEKEIKCKAVIGGKLSDRKSMSFPGKVLKQEYLSDQDKQDLLFGTKNDVDFIACSFVSCAEDVKQIRAFLDAYGGDDIQLIAKIENRSGIDNLEEILNVVEGLMVARGDLGVEIPYAELPAIQKQMIRMCRDKGAICITATEMLESMTENPRPTRAEISDVANAVFDATSAVMLSGESAAGKYPSETVAAMTSIILDAEAHTHYERRFGGADLQINTLADALSHAGAQLAINAKAKVVVTSTVSGFTARMMERYRVPVPVVGFTYKEKTYRQMDMYWNVTPYLAPKFNSLEELVEEGSEACKELGFAKAGDVAVVTGGFSNKAGGTKILHADVIR